MSEEHLFLAGPVGPLEALMTKPKSENPSRVAIIFHPHPLHEGTMYNKVVTTLAKAFALKGYATVRFNYRGVGKSEGQYGEIQGEVEDGLAVYAWVKKTFPQAAISLAGFSFGAYISACIANQKPCAQLISVAPAVNHAPFSSLHDINCPWMVVQGEQDEIVPFSDVSAFVEASDKNITFKVFPNASHFFHGQLIPLREFLLAATA